MKFLKSFLFVVARVPIVRDVVAGILLGIRDALYKGIRDADAKMQDAFERANLNRNSDEKDEE